MKGSSDDGFIIPTGQEKKKNEKNPGSAEKESFGKMTNGNDGWCCVF
jgi:hypothetical protein